MATVNERLRDFEVSHQIRLLRLSNGESKRLLDILRKTDDRLDRLLRQRRRPLSTMRRERLGRLRDQVRVIISETQAAQVRSTVNSLVEEVVAEEVAAQTRALQRAVGAVGLDVAQIGLGAAVAAARSRPVDGTPLAQLTNRLSRGDFERVWGEINAGITAGLTNDEIARGVMGTVRLRDGGVRQVTRRGAAALVRTVNTHVTSVARNEVWRANEDLIRGVLWVSTLDGRTTPICQALDGREFPMDEGPRPPVHINCRSVTTPIVRSLGDIRERIGATRAASLRTRPGEVTPFDGEVPAVLTYSDWLGRQPAAFQREVLGPTKYALFQETGDLRPFVTRELRPLTIPELRRKMPEVFDAAGL